MNTILPVTESTEWIEIGSGLGTTLLNLVDDMGAATNQPFQSTDPLSEDPSLQRNSKFWENLQLPLAEENAATVTEPTHHDKLSSQSQHQALVSAPDRSDFLFTSLAPSDNLPASSFPDPFSSLSNPAPTQDVSVGTRLMQVKDKMEQAIESMGTSFFSHSSVEDCEKDAAFGMEPTNPVSVFLECTNEFLDVIQNLIVVATNASNHDNHQMVTTDAASWDTPSSSLSSETTLLLLSCYLSLMRLCDSFFHGVCHAFSQVKPESFKSVKVKAAFRVGGITSLQDITAKSYAMGIIDVVQGQMQHVERCMGLPAAYCILGEEDVSSSEVPGLDMFSSHDRARLLRAVLEQEDVRAHRGNKSCVQSIRENLKNTVAFLG